MSESLKEEIEGVWERIRILKANVNAEVDSTEPDEDKVSFCNAALGFYVKYLSILDPTTKGKKSKDNGNQAKQQGKTADALT